MSNFNNLPAPEESPMTLLSDELRCARILSSAKNTSASSSIGAKVASKISSQKKRLLSSGLRVSTPPTSRLVPRRLQLVPDENNPPPAPVESSLLSPPSGWKSRRTLLEDLDHNSQDSGCAMSTCSGEDSSSNFRFAQPCGFAPKRNSSMESPRRCLTFLSDNSQSSVDDGFLDMLGDGDEENAQLPLGLGSLISGQILAGPNDSPSPIKRPFRRCTSETATPVRRRSVSFRDQEEYTLKRPLKDRPIELSPQKTRLKRVKSTMDGVENGTLFAYGFWKKASPLPDEETPIKIPSESEIEIKLALQRSAQEELIGDFTVPFALPLVSGKHLDLKAISCDTLAQLLKGEYNDKINSFRIIDCRYPYEFKAGHIVGAENLYTCDHITKEFLNDKPKPEKSGDDRCAKRDIVIFHCEFSSERGPFLSRFLRKEDRSVNEYPSLHYPEVYLLDGGYSTFFQAHRDLCDPQDYRMMQDPAHSSEFKHFRAKSKTWAPGNHRKSTMRSLSRLNY